jgi:hypothetical protein
LEENVDKPDRMMNVYDKPRAAMNATWRKGIAAGDLVQAVADKVVKVATDKEPSIRYMPGKTAGRFRLMQRYVPEKTFEKSFRTRMGVTDLSL